MVFPDDLYDPQQPPTRRGPTVAPEEWTALIDAVGGICASLGVSPAQSSATGLSYGTVDARLEAIEAALIPLARTALVDLEITNNATAPDTKLDISWSALAINGRLSLGFSGTLDSGVQNVPNGRNFGTVQNSTWYYIYAIYNPTTGTAATLLCEDEEDPGGLPTGYSLYRRIGAVRVDNSGQDFLRYRQQNARVVYHGDWSKIELNVQTGGLSGTFVDVSCATAVPLTARLVTVQVSLVGLNGTLTAYMRGGGGTALGGDGIKVLEALGTMWNFEWHAAGIELPLLSQNVQYKASTTSTTGGVRVDVQGYVDSI